MLQPSSDQAGLLRAVIAVPTFHRNDELARLLPMLREQMFATDASCRLLVIDNDPQAGAQPVVQQFNRVHLRTTRVGYVAETQPGIAAVRNRALRESADADVIIFIDDDETPQPGWLDALLTTYREHRPASVVGPVVSSFETPTPEWVEAGGFFQRPRRQTGTQVSLAATNNLLVDLDTQRSLGLTFDERFGISGGSDTLFTRELVQSGSRIIWCDEALVIDHVPADRNSREWVMKRAYRAGNTWSRTSLALAAGSVPKTLIARLRLVGEGSARVAGGSLKFAWGKLSRNQRHEARGARTVVRGAGMLAGVVNVVHYEYRRAEPVTAAA